METLPKTNQQINEDTEDETCSLTAKILELEQLIEELRKHQIGECCR